MNTKQPSPASGASGPVLISSLMSRSPVTIDEGARVSDAVALMEQRHVAHLPVTKAGKLVGLLSQTHIHDAMPSVLTLKDPEARKKALYLAHVSQVCQRAPRTVTPSTPVADAIDAMREARVGSVIVVEGDAVVGIVTNGDLLTFLQGLLRR